MKKKYISFCPRCNSVDIVINKELTSSLQYNKIPNNICNRCKTILPEFPKIFKSELPPLRDLKEVQREIESEQKENKLKEDMNKHFKKQKIQSQISLVILAIVIILAIRLIIYSFN